MTPQAAQIAAELDRLCEQASADYQADPRDDTKFWVWLGLTRARHAVNDILHNTNTEKVTA